MYSYIPFHHAIREGTDSYLQITASFDERDLCGRARNASIGGDFLGPICTGITTYNLLQHPFFTENIAAKKEWALEIWMPTQPVHLQGIKISNEIHNGIIVKGGHDGEQPLPVTGGKLHVALHTTDVTLRKQDNIEAELLASTGKLKVVSWSIADKPTVQLKKTGEGLYTAEIIVDGATAEYIRKDLKARALGVRVIGGELPLLGWITIPQDDGETTGIIDRQQLPVSKSAMGRAEWKELTAGEELARGKRVRLIPSPDYRLTTDENDPYDLTDGTLSTQPDDRIWHKKDAVGWYGADGAFQTAVLLLDLEESKPIGQIAIRLLAGKEQDGLRLPNNLAFYASDDGKTWHVLQKMQKLMPAERALSDFKTAFYVPEEGTAFVQAFVCQESVRARYIAIRIEPEASAFTDQISVLKADSDKPSNSLSAYPVAPFFSDGVIARPRQPEFALLTGIHTPNRIVLESYLEKPYKTLQVEIDLPAGVNILCDDSNQIKPSGAEDNARHSYAISKTESLKNNGSNFFL